MKKVLFLILGVFVSLSLLSGEALAGACAVNLETNASNRDGNLVKIKKGETVGFKGSTFFLDAKFHLKVKNGQLLSCRKVSQFNPQVGYPSVKWECKGRKASVGKTAEVSFYAVNKSCGRVYSETVEVAVE